MLRVPENKVASFRSCPQCGQPAVNLNVKGATVLRCENNHTWNPKLERKDGAPKLEEFITKFQIKSVSDKGEIEGYGSVFGVVDSVNDIVAKGAFANSIRLHKAEGTSPKMLWQHDPAQPCGIWTEFDEDQHGLRLKGQLLLETRIGKEAYEFTKTRAVDGMSIGFKTIRYEYQTETDIRVLTEVDLWEVSLVTFPALRSARVTAVKSELTERRVEEILRDVGFSQKQAKAMTAAWKTIVPHRDGGGRDATTESIQGSLNKLLASMGATKNQ